MNFNFFLTFFVVYLYVRNIALYSKILKMEQEKLTMAVRQETRPLLFKVLIDTIIMMQDYCSNVREQKTIEELQRMNFEALRELHKFLSQRLYFQS